MNITRYALCMAYGLMGLTALLGTWSNNRHYLDLGFLEANARFWQETLVNPASRSITIDILWLGLAAIVWMLLEARRLSMRGVWLWILFGIFVAMSAALPWFLVHREILLARSGGGDHAGTLSVGDLVGLLLIGLALLVYTFFAWG
ncbi:DUF2834 domain-containing protein [Methylotetracoccus oryzae]|uniref:DUF2834 domain-containing protein n=1 Tax=Methylotetracoccus oryzae TaxID=1919059 RepID=UPI0011185862|nr:DUF2834 domain-containing protein [Methylotetracoccus oryzae]